jgi:hypothetical protein
MVLWGKPEMARRRKRKRFCPRNTPNDKKIEGKNEKRNFLLLERPAGENCSSPGGEWGRKKVCPQGQALFRLKSRSIQALYHIRGEQL